ncbi:MAG: DUF262 domain-containing protein [Eggerthellaceae bacterium]|nr:DUF262 domain-containing protein [Eggerthellaceae bacterium]
MDFKTVFALMSSNYYAIPDYQRDYSWTDAQTSTLFEDITALLKEEEQGPHFLGAIVTTPYESDSGTDKAFSPSEYSIDTTSIKHVVDGQQRLTTLAILIKALLDAKNDDLDSTSQAKLKFVFNQAEGCLFGGDLAESGMPAPKLILNGNSGRFLASRVLEIRDDECSGKYTGARRMQKAYANFKNEIESLRDECVGPDSQFENVASFYKSLVSVVMSKLNLVEIECNTSANAFQVFDSLNGKGLDLTAADRIKNLFLSWCPKNKSGSQKWNSMASEVGEDDLVRFFSCLLYYKSRKRVSKRRMPDEFKIRYKDTAIADFDFFYKQMKSAAVIYGKLKNRKTGNKTVDSELLLDLADIKQEQAYVMLMAAPMAYGQDVFERKDYVEYVKTLINLVVRMQVCQKSTNKLDTIFADCLVKMADEQAIQVITERIRQRTLEIADDKQFEAAFTRLTFKDTRTASYYLRKLENAMRKEDGNRDPVSRSGAGSSLLTVEHVIPQTLESLEDWYGVGVSIPKEIEDQFNEQIVQSIGNMALIYQDDNSAAGNKSYEEKLSVYKTGSSNGNVGTPYATFAAIKELVDDYPTVFTHKEVDARSAKLAEYAVQIW